MVKALLFLLQGIPEMMGILAFSLAFAGVPLRWGVIAAVGTVLAVIIYIIRSLPLAFGLHTAAALLLVTIIIAKTTCVPPSKSFISVFASFSILVTLELIIHEFFFFLTKQDPQAVISNYLLWKLIGLPQAFLMIILALLIARLKTPVEGAWKI
ncbi:MAG: hypothetical protein HPY89_03125 [Pelotomaculum sp.]|uniref:Hypothetical membrane protein n=1 Tax=Pelotomaculum thermopropionicum (strain DSM 13744 / JCM 10971 / SI) TaxID=370438 RepID=A5D1E5_PELTS|nr:hypothetical protein [Pelotomaculum sp.]BAF59957.1 hypothetical membrane protein [Pelotomaculum thermopropionicum SI]